MKALKGRSGKTSSKRIAGFYLVGCGSLSLIAVSVLSMVRFGNYQTALDAGKFLVMVGAGLLGVGIFEGFGAKVGGDGKQ